MQDAWRAYLELALGLTEASRKKAREVARDLVGKGEATAAQTQSLVNDLISTSRTNREGLARLVRYEVDRALGAVGLATADEVADLTGRLRDVERRLNVSGTAAAEPAAAGAASTGTPAAGSARASRTAAKQTTPKPAVAQQTTAQQTTAQQTAAKKTVAKKVAKKKVAKRTVAKKTAAKRAAAEPAGTSRPSGAATPSNRGSTRKATG